MERLDFFNTMNGKYIKIAVKLAKKGGKEVRCGAFVGCVIVKNNKIIGQGYHKKFGSPHAEVEAIKNATENVVGADLYVTLEPCCHHGKTPPCTDLIILSGIKKVIYGTKDLNSVVDGLGIKTLQNAGIETIESTLKEECSDLNKVFFANKTKDRPFINVKIAATLNGKVADRNGESKWITSEKSRDYVHKKLRKSCDAMMTTAKTILTDNPMMNVRAGGSHQERHCIIIDKNLDIIKQSTLNIFSRKKTKVFILTKQYQEVLIPNVIIIECKIRDDGGLDISQALNILLLKYNICEILVEAGGSFTADLLQHNLVDEVCYFMAPSIIYDSQAISAFTKNISNLLSAKKNGKIVEVKQIGPDLFSRIRF